MEVIMHRIHPLLLVLGSMLSFAAVPSSFAAVASVSIDWSQLQTQVLPISGLPAPSLTFSGQSTRLTSNSSGAGDGFESQEHLLHNWTDARNLATHTTTSDGTASANSSSISASASAIEPLTGECCGSGGDGSVRRSASFTLNGPGSLIFSVPYALSGSGTPAESSSASINGSLTFFSNDGGFSQGSRSIDLGSFFSAGPFSQSGTLVFGIVADAAGSGSFDVGLAASAGNFSGPFIPEPSVFLELAAGLSAIIVIGRRRAALVAKRFERRPF
jgi:hypothetical protein